MDMRTACVGCRQKRASSANACMSTTDAECAALLALAQTRLEFRRLASLTRYQSYRDSELACMQQLAPRAVRNCLSPVQRRGGICGTAWGLEAASSHFSQRSRSRRGTSSSIGHAASAAAHALLSVPACRHLQRGTHRCIHTHAPGLCITPALQQRRPLLLSCQGGARVVRAALLRQHPLLQHLELHQQLPLLRWQVLFNTA